MIAVYVYIGVMVVIVAAAYPVSYFTAKRSTRKLIDKMNGRQW